MFSINNVQTQLTQFYQTKLPDFDKITDVEAVSGGWEAELYRFRLHTGNAAPQSLIIRLFAGDQDEKASREFAAMQGLKRLNYPVPTVYHLTTFHESRFDGSHFMMDFVEGRLLWDMMMRDGQIDVELITQFCQLMVDLHQLEWDGVFDAPSGSDNPYFAIDTFLDVARTAIQQETLADFAPYVDWMIERHDLIPSQRLSITHNDFHPYNVLVKNDGHMVVIDWPNMQLSDYRNDLAWTLLLAGTYESRTASDGILQAYQAVRGEAIEHLDIFMVIAIARRLSDMAISIRGSAAERGMRSEAVDAMRQQANHFRACYAWLTEITDIRSAGIEELLETL